MDYIVYADNSPFTILQEKEILSLFRHPLFTENAFWNLLEQKVILRRDFEALKKNIDEVMRNSELMRFHWIADSVKMCLESAKDCIYLRQETVDNHRLKFRIATGGFFRYSLMNGRQTTHDCRRDPRLRGGGRFQPAQERRLRDSEREHKGRHESPDHCEEGWGNALHRGPDGLLPG